MSKLSVDAKEAAAVVARLCGGTLELKDSGFRLKAPGMQLSIDVRRFDVAGSIEKGALKADVHSVTIREAGIDVDFAMQ
jgi:hypothetical protein